VHLVFHGDPKHLNHPFHRFFAELVTFTGSTRVTRHNMITNANVSENRIVKNIVVEIMAATSLFAQWSASHVPFQPPAVYRRGPIR
jgi:hypothetical protein